MKKIFLSFFTLGIILASCNKEEIVTVAETEAESVEENQVTSKEDDYAFNKELSVLDESGEHETKFLISAESEELYNDFMQKNKLVVTFIPDFEEPLVKNTPEKNKYTSNVELEKPKINIELLNSTLGGAIQLDFIQKEVTNTTKAYNGPGIPYGYTSSADNVLVTVQNSPNIYDIIGQYNFKIKWYSPWRNHHTSYTLVGATSNNMIGPYHKSQATIYPDVLAGQTIYWTVTWY